MLAGKIFLSLRIIFLMLIAASTFAQRKTQKTILFVCEHGSAKSIVAAAHFNRAAKKEGIQLNVIARGTNPDAIVPEKINTLLQKDGFPAYENKPIQLTNEDIQIADYVVTFNPLPSVYNNIPKVEQWNIPSLEDRYPAARDSILVNIRRIIDRIKTDNQN